MKILEKLTPLPEDGYIGIRGYAMKTARLVIHERYDQEKGGVYQEGHPTLQICCPCCNGGCELHFDCGNNGCEHWVTCPTCEGQGWCDIREEFVPGEESMFFFDGWEWGDEVTVPLWIQDRMRHHLVFSDPNQMTLFEEAP